MGLFHDTCEAIIDLKTGSALTGAALEEARALLRTTSRWSRSDELKKRGWGICGHEVSKKARFCSKCGHGAPNGWVKCPSCHTWVGNDSSFCPHCNYPLHPDERPNLAGGVWDREPGVFAQRIELSDVTGIAKGGLKIQEGTVAILLDAGKKSAILGPGRHNPEGTLRTINWFGNPPPHSVVMVDSGDCVFRVEFPGMRTAEELPVKVVAEVTLRFDPGEANGFLANVMKAARGVTAGGGEGQPKPAAGDGTESDRANRLYAEDIGTWLLSEASAAVKDLCLQSKIEDLVKDPERRPRFEDAIGRALKDLLKRSGLELVRVGYVDFVSAEYEAMRKQYGELDAKRRQLEYDRKLHEHVLDVERESREHDLTRLTEANAERYRREVIAADSERDLADLNVRKVRDDAQRVQDTEEYLAQLAQEKGLSGISREVEMKIARMAADGQIDAKQAEEELAKLSREHTREFAELDHQFELENRKLDHQFETEKQKLDHQFETDSRMRAHVNDEALADAQGKSKVNAVLRDEALKDAGQQDAIDDIRRSGQVKDAQTGSAVKKESIDIQNYETRTAQELAQAAMENQLKNLARLQELDAKERENLAKAVKGLSPVEMAALEKDPEQRRQLMELARLQQDQELEKLRLEAEKEMTAEQLLAREAGRSATAAQALAAKAQADAQAAAAQAAA
ncbi:MAG: zinc ribbon domain-containing protein, partial [Kiritimatiellae bacterium]|nr:zinc ribbon domain-containing protein [Kiritimatiellia bacterium]